MLLSEADPRTLMVTLLVTVVVVLLSARSTTPPVEISASVLIQSDKPPSALMEKSPKSLSNMELPVIVIDMLRYSVLSALTALPEKNPPPSACVVAFRRALDSLSKLSDSRAKTEVSMTVMVLNWFTLLLPLVVSALTANPILVPFA